MKTFIKRFSDRVLQSLILLLICLLSTILTAAAQNNDEISKTQKVMVLGHAHMDPVYRWRWNEIENREIFKTFSDVLGMLEKYPELKFAQSYLLYYATIQEHFPDLFEEVKKSISEKQWSVVGGQWVETDETLPSGESMIRQFLIANDYYSKNLGIENIDISWTPDVFTGHPVTLPKIYAGCGIKTHVFSRESPNDKKIFWWESKDASRILAYKIPGHYNPEFKQLNKQIADWKSISGYDLPLITIGKGDHGGGPGESDFRALRMLSNQFNIEFEHISPEDYFDILHNSGKDWPVQNTEFGYRSDREWWLGCYTSQAKIKKYNRHLENQLIAAEKFLAIGTMHKGKPFYPREDFITAWKILLFNQFHDIIPGTLTGLGADDAIAEYIKLDQISSELLTNGLENIGNRINTEMEGTPLVIYNPHSWQVSQFVNAELNFVKETDDFQIKDPKGENVPFSVINKSKDKTKYLVTINAQNIPSFGYKVFKVKDKISDAQKSDLKITENQIENSKLKIQWDKHGITSIFSKKLNKEIVNGTANFLQLLEDNGSSWGLNLTGKEYSIISLNEPEIIYSSAQQVEVKWEDYFQSSKFTRYMTVSTNSDEIDFKMEIDWHGNNKLLRLAFATNIQNGEAYYDQPYGYVKRPETTREWPAQKWIDLSNKNFGLALLNNGKYGFTINKGQLTMSVVRGARDMDPRMDEGKHTFKYKLIIHEGDWRDADIPLKALELNQPLIALQENHHPGEISGWKFSNESFPMEKSFFSIDSDHVIISSLKTKQDAYDPNPLILRIIETEGRDENVIVKLPYEPVSVTECNHLEKPIEPRSKITVGEKQFGFEMGNDQIRTFMIQF